MGIKLLGITKIHITSRTEFANLGASKQNFGLLVAPERLIARSSNCISQKGAGGGEEDESRG